MARKNELGKRDPVKINPTPPAVRLSELGVIIPHQRNTRLYQRRKVRVIIANQGI